MIRMISEFNVFCEIINFDKDFMMNSFRNKKYIKLFS
jgi:hypothetical protein